MTDAAAARAANQPPQKQDVQVVIPIAYGTQARPLTEAERAKHKDHTTAWTVYVRGPSGESLAYAVDRVIFHLHESIVPPVRTIVAPAPFEVHETGWGEFDIGIEVVFRGSGAAGLQPVKLTAPLKLFPESVDTAVYPALVGLKQVDPARPGWLVTEKYDEVVVSEPSAELYDAVVANVDRSWPIRGTVWGTFSNLLC
ncbi:yeats family-domain-containing protein [Blastocladiella britannica]|nr:yeats family-domain-containing protein [Blastocladiella britannica]